MNFLRRYSERKVCEVCDRQIDRQADTIGMNITKTEHFRW